MRSCPPFWSTSVSSSFFAVSFQKRHPRLEAQAPSARGTPPHHADVHPSPLKTCSFLSSDSVISLPRVSGVCRDDRSACSISRGNTLPSGQPDTKRRVVFILPLTLTSTLNPSSPHLSDLYPLSQHCSKKGQTEVSLSDAISVYPPKRRGLGLYAFRIILYLQH